MNHSRLKQIGLLITTHKQRVFVKNMLFRVQRTIRKWIGVDKSIEELTREIERLKLKVEVLQGEVKLFQNPKFFEERGIQVVRSPSKNTDHSKMHR